MKVIHYYKKELTILHEKLHTVLKEMEINISEADSETIEALLLNIMTKGYILGMYSSELDATKP